MLNLQSCHFMCNISAWPMGILFTWGPRPSIPPTKWCSGIPCMVNPSTTPGFQDHLVCWLHSLDSLGVHLPEMWPINPQMIQHEQSLNHQQTGQFWLSLRLVPVPWYTPRSSLYASPWYMVFYYFQYMDGSKNSDCGIVCGFCRLPQLWLPLRHCQCLWQSLLP